MIKTFILTLALFFASCSHQKENELILATNVWIGFTPIFYAKEKGYFDEIDLKVITTVSLAEASNIFLVSKANLLTATQYEYNLLKEEIDSIVPILLIDRSYGGDMILSNRNLEELKQSKSINVYLEVDSINKEIIEAFTKHHNLNTKTMHYINKDQSQIQNIKAVSDKDILIVTYSPNEIQLQKEGFKEIASTKNTEELLVIDALFTCKEVLQRDKKRLLKLKAIIDKSIIEIMSDKKSAHALTRKYLDDITYEEFENSLKNIKWINKPSDELLLKIEALGYKKEELL